MGQWTSRVLCSAFSPAGQPSALAGRVIIRNQAKTLAPAAWLMVPRAAGSPWSRTAHTTGWAARGPTTALPDVGVTATSSSASSTAPATQGRPAGDVGLEMRSVLARTDRDRLRPDRLHDVAGRCRTCKVPRIRSRNLRCTSTPAPTLWGSSQSRV